MKAITIRQPWAWLIFHGKDVENRSWRTNHQGPLAIHASEYRRKIFADEWAKAYKLLLKINPRLADALTGNQNFVHGAIIGTVEQVTCRPHSDSPWFFGPYAHIYRNAVLLDKPLPCPGKLSIWETDLL